MFYLMKNTNSCQFSTLVSKHASKLSSFEVLRLVGEIYGKYFEVTVFFIKCTYIFQSKIQGLILKVYENEQLNSLSIMID